VPDSDVQSLVQFLQADVPLWNLSISLTCLKATLQPAGGGPDADYRNDPPKIIVVDHPAILLLLDGEPRMQDAGAGLQQVVNTALPVIFDPGTRQYWFYGSSVWFTTGNLLHGRWTWADRAPTNIANLVQDTDTLEAAQTDAGKAASPAQLRAATIVVSTEPAELIVTEGSPRYSPLVGGEILYVTNSESDIFMEVATQRHYLVISGRWFAGPSMQGPWTFVAPENLPRAFANIPENSPKAGDLAFVVKFAQQISCYVLGKERSVATVRALDWAWSAGKYFCAQGGELPTVLADRGMEEILGFDVRPAALSRRPKSQEDQLPRSIRIALEYGSIMGARRG